MNATRESGSFGESTVPSTSTRTVVESNKMIRDLIAQERQEKGELSFETIDNPAKWSAFTFRWKFAGSCNISTVNSLSEVQLYVSERCKGK
jgi:hypothetical protein